jgi:hypothetical protein
VVVNHDTLFFLRGSHVFDDRFFFLLFLFCRIVWCLVTEGASISLVTLLLISVLVYAFFIFILSCGLLLLLE